MRQITVYAHRGSALHARENTAAAFDSALHLGFKAFELDLLRLKDGTIVVFHDFTLRRQFGKLKRIRSVTLKEFRKINPDLLTFDEFVDRYAKKKITVNFEVKDDSKTLRAMLPGIAKFHDPVISSFRRTVVDAALSEGLEAGYLFHTMRAFRAGQKKMKGNRLHISKNLLRSRNKPTKVFSSYNTHVYTVNDPIEALSLSAFPFVHGIFTDSPDVMRAFQRK